MDTKSFFSRQEKKILVSFVSIVVMQTFELAYSVDFGAFGGRGRTSLLAMSQLAW